jgi:hypothetical protein
MATATPRRNSVRLSVAMWYSVDAAKEATAFLAVWRPF